MARILREEGKFRIEENENYEPGHGNVFLMVRSIGKNGETREVCVGSADREVMGEWRVIVSKEYDPETDSDAEVVGTRGIRSDAVQCLWNNRHRAHIYI